MSDQTTLNWTLLNEDGRDVQALTELGTYTISVDSDIAGGTHYLWVAWQTEEDEHISVHRFMREAKAAAELDYSQRRGVPTLVENYREPGEFGEGATVRRAEATRPIVGIENRTAKEVFDIMCARIHALNAQVKADHACEIADMATRFRAVNVERLSENLGADVFAMREKMNAQEEVLRKIAAYDDAAANAYLRATGSYRCFDEPGAVELARGVLEGKTDG